MTESDIPLVAGYFVSAGVEFLEAMGVDKSKMPSRNQWNEKLTQEFNKPIGEKEFYYIIWLLDEKPIGHSNINKIEFGESATMHIHLWYDEHRRKNLGSLFILKTIPYYFNNFNLKKIISEPYAFNPAPNFLLKKTGFTFIKTYETVPGWLNFHQSVNHYELTKPAFEKMNNIIEVVRNELKIRSDAKNRESGRRYFKETIQLYGVRAAEVRRISKENFKAVSHLPKKEIFDLCEIFWQSGMIEENFIACDWSYFLHKQYEPADFGMFERWVDTYISNWATCDTLCNHNMGAMVMMYPAFLQDMKRFAKSENRWKKRAAAVSLIIPARKGYFLSDILEIAEILLSDKDDMVQKGYGWMLKESSKAHRQEVYDYVISKKAIMPRTALRYAIEKMPEEMRKKAMEK